MAKPLPNRPPPASVHTSVVYASSPCMAGAELKVCMCTGFSIPSKPSHHVQTAVLKSFTGRTSTLVRVWRCVRVFRGDVDWTLNQSRFSHPARPPPPRDVLAVQLLQPPTKTLKAKLVDCFSLSKAVPSTNKPQFHVGIINKVGAKSEEKVMTSLRWLKRTEGVGWGWGALRQPSTFHVVG